MGSLIGHVIPGSAIFLFGYLHLLQCLRSYSYHKSKGMTYRFTSMFSHKVSSHVMKVYYEISYLTYGRIFASLLGMIIESVGFFTDEVMLRQHFTMYFMFFIAGWVEIGIVKNVQGFTEGLQNVIYALAFFAQSFLFTHHLHERPMLDVVLHQLLALTAFLSSIFIIIVAFVPDSTISMVLCACFILTNGSWFLEAGGVLYPIGGEPMDLNSHESIMIVTNHYIYHLVINFLLVLALMHVMAKLYDVEPVSNQQQEIYCSGDSGTGLVGTTQNPKNKYATKT